MSKVTTLVPWGHPRQKEEEQEHLSFSVSLQVAQMLLEYPFQWHQAASIPTLSEFRQLLHQSVSPSPSMFGALGGAGLAGHKLSMSTKDRHGAALCFSKITIKRGFHIRPPRGSKGKVSLPVCYSNFGGFPPPFGNKNGLLMPELMLTKARWNKKPPAPQYQHPISSQHSLPSRTSSRTFQESLVACQRELLSSASPGHLWVCPGPPRHRMALCHPLVAGRLAVALRWPHPGPLVQGRQGSAFSILLIPASLLWPFAPRD